MGVSSLAVTRLRLRRRRAATAWRRADRALCFTDLDRRRSTAAVDGGGRRRRRGGGLKACKLYIA